MARYGRLGPMIKDSPEIEEKYGPRNPEDISSYETRGGIGIEATQYFGPTRNSMGGGEIGFDIEKSNELAAYRKKYGPAFENKLLQEAIRIGWGPGSMKGMPYTGIDNMNQAQDLILIEMRNIEKLNGLRAAHQQVKKNPMLY